MIQSIVTRQGKPLLFSFDYPPRDGGISRLCAELVSGVLRGGVPVGVLSQVHHADLGSNIPAAEEVRVTARRPWREWWAFQELRNGHARGPVICDIWYPEGLLAVLARVRPLVLLAHGLELMPCRSIWRRPIWRVLCRWVLTRADIVVADSSYTAGLVRRAAPAANVVPISLAVDAERFSPADRRQGRCRLGIPEDKRVLLTVARVNRYKGHDLVFQGLATLPESVRERFVYLIAGRGADMESLKAEADQLGLGTIVRWLGYVSEQHLPDLYRAADLFVLCTREAPDRAEVEGFGLVFLEAQACGTPVVGTRAGGIPDAVKHGKGGWLIHQDDWRALAAILRRLADNPEEFRAMGAVARRRVEADCTWDRYVDRFVAALKSSGIDGV